MYGRVQFFFAEHTCYLFKRGGRKESPFFLTVVWLAVVVNRGSSTTAHQRHLRKVPECIQPASSFQVRCFSFLCRCLCVVCLDCHVRLFPPPSRGVKNALRSVSLSRLFNLVMSGVGLLGLISPRSPLEAITVQTLGALCFSPGGRFG